MATDPVSTYYYDFGKDFSRYFHRRITSRYGYTQGINRDPGLSWYAKKIVRKNGETYSYSKNKFTKRRHIRKKEKERLLFQIMISEDMNWRKT